MARKRKRQPRADGQPAAQPADAGGILTDPHHTRADIRLAMRAVRNRWPVPEGLRGEIVERLRAIVNKERAEVVTMRGVEAIDAPADSNAINAAKVLVAMEAQNQADEHLAEKNARIDEGRGTEVVQVVFER